MDEHDDPYEEAQPRAISMTDMSVDDIAEGSAADMLVSQSRNKLFVALILLALVGVAAYLHFFVHRTEPDSVLLAVRVDDAQGPAAYWWGGNEGATDLLNRLELELEPSGLLLLPRTEELVEQLAEVDSQDALRDVAARLGVGHVLLVSLSSREQIERPESASMDHVLALEIAVLDVDANTVVEAERAPYRLFGGGADLEHVLHDNARFVARFMRGPALELLAAQPRLARYGEDTSAMNSDEQVTALRLGPMFSMAAAQAQALELRGEVLAEAQAAEFVEHSGKARTRLGAYLDQDYMIGPAADGRLVIKHDPHQVWWREGQDYAIYEAGEQLLLTDREGKQRERVFERYNVYSYPSISADGNTVGLVLDNHGWSKTLATVAIPSGELTALLTDPEAYYSTPKPSADGSLVAFFAQSSRGAKSSLELVEVATGRRKLLLDTDTRFTIPSWSPTGDLFLAVGEYKIRRVVKLDPRTGALTHLLGIDPNPEPGEGEDPEDELEAVLAEAGELPPADPVVHSLFDRVSVNYDGSALYVAEVSTDGTDYVGRFELASGDYLRLAQVEAYSLLASPSDDRVALQTTSGEFTTEGDPSSSDTEVLVLGPEPGPPEVVTLNAVDEDLMSWSRDGRSLFVSDQTRDPNGDRYSARIYRYDLDE